MMPDLIVFVVATIIVSILTFVLLVYRGRLVRVTNMLTQTTLDKIVLADKLNTEIEKSQGASIEQTDGFLKFVSESRDWAFQYIEEVQAALKEFDQVILRETQSVDSLPAESLTNIIDAYRTLKEVLPKE